LAERKSKYEENKTKISVYEQLKELTNIKREKDKDLYYQSIIK